MRELQATLINNGTVCRLHINIFYVKAGSVFNIGTAEALRKKHLQIYSVKAA
jgi:hypothetical protein